MLVRGLRSRNRSQTDPQVLAMGAVMVACECKDVHNRKRIVLTGGPGAGKTALL